MRDWWPTVVPGDSSETCRPFALKVGVPGCRGASGNREIAFRIGSQGDVNGRDQGSC